MTNNRDRWVSGWFHTFVEIEIDSIVAQKDAYESYVAFFRKYNKSGYTQKWLLPPAKFGRELAIWYHLHSFVTTRDGKRFRAWRNIKLKDIPQQ